MKIDISNIDSTQFMTHPHQIAGELVWLVQPQHVGAKWTKDNLFLRSSVWNAEGELISAGFPKFFNLGEKPECYPDPDKHNDWNVLEKKDGSLLIVSKYKGEMIFRTRGTVDARKIDNGYEIDYLLEKYPEIVKYFSCADTWDASLLFEWCTPTNTIVVKVDEPQLTLVGGINHKDYSLFSQKALDILSNLIGVPRPQRFSFNTLSEALAVVKEFKGMEGVCLYFNNDQNIVKLKGDWYLSCHRMRSELNNIENVLDIFLNEGQPSYQEFYQFIVDTMDFEIAEMCRGFISEICDAKKQVDAIIQHMRGFVAPLTKVSRKEAAIAIQSAYSTTNRSAFCFKLLDGKELEKDSIKKLFFQILKHKK